MLRMAMRLQPSNLALVHAQLANVSLEEEDVCTLREHGGSRAWLQKGAQYNRLLVDISPHPTLLNIEI